MASYTTRRSVASSRAGIRNLRAEKTQRYVGISDNMAGQTKNLHGVFLSFESQQPELQGTLFFIQSAS
jgi:hypothetical protein